MVYTNCRQLPIHNFNEIILTNDLAFLLKDLKDLNDQKSQAFPKEDLEIVWQKILEEFSELTNDDSNKKMFRQKSEILFLEQKLNALRCIFILGQLDLNEDQNRQYLELRKKFKVKDIKKSIASTENQLRLKIDDFKRIYANETSPKSFEYNLTRISKVLGFQINRYTTTVAEWIQYIQTAEETIKNLEKNKASKS